MSIFTVLEIWQIQHHHQFNLLWFNMIFIIIIGFDACHILFTSYNS